MNDTAWSAEEAALLAPYVTNLERPVFGLRNLPEVVKGALFSRYSRSEKSLRRMLLDEFMQDAEADFVRLVGVAAADQLIAVEQAEQFYDRVLLGYGDDSVAELGGAHVACERISNIAAKALEDSRLGIDPLEKSTRYVAFNQRIDGQYQYAREPQIMASSHAASYVAAMDGLFDTYTALLEPTLAAVRAATPHAASASVRAYNAATRAKTLDLLRGLLPMATLTNVGLFGNGRAFEYLITKLHATALPELHTLATALQTELEQLIPAFVRRASSPRGLAYQRYLANTRSAVAAQAAAHPLEPAGDSPLVQLIDYDPEAEAKLVADILYPHSDAPLEQLVALAHGLPAAERVAIIASAIGQRESRFQRPGRAFEQPYYHFDLCADIGAYRDLQRHRILTQERQRYTTRHGFVTPPELLHTGGAVRYAAALEQAAAAFETLSADLPEAAQYAVPFAFRIRWRVRLNLREAIHLLELRSAPQGHPSYRAIAQAMFQQISAVHPTLAASMEFVDLNSYALERLEAERRFDARLERSGGNR